MKYKDKRYLKQGIHVLACIFTVKNGDFKILLINRKLEPFKNMWSLVGGALYNNETVEDGLRREIFEKSGIKDIELINFGIYSRVDRAPNFRMVALPFITVIDSEKYEILRETSHTNDARWFSISKLPEMAFDHDEIVRDGIKYLKENIESPKILKNLLPKEFALPELLKTYESAMGIKLDRRNFRKKLITNKVIEDTGKMQVTKGVKSSKLYRFSL